MASSNPRYTGWPVWCDSRSFTDDSARPFVFDGYWEALIVSLDRGFGDHIDYWRLSPDGKFYLHRALQDDVGGGDRTPAAGTVLDFALMILRIAECVVVAIDIKRKYEVVDDKEIIKDKEQQFWFEVYTHGGRVETGIDALQWIREVQDLGAGELLITSMDSDGTKDGYDLSLMKRVSEISNLPNIASGGCGNLNHFHDVLTIGCSDAALAASIFHYKELTISLQCVKAITHKVVINFIMQV